MRLAAIAIATARPVRLAIIVIFPLSKLVHMRTSEAIEMIASENYIYTNSKRECNIEYYQYYRRADAKKIIVNPNADRPSGEKLHD